MRRRPSIATRDGREDDATSLGDGRLSRISRNTKCAIALNQIDRLAVNSTYEREEDGVTMYVVDVTVLCVQKGIPTAPHENPEDTKSRNPHYRMAYRFSEFYQLRNALQAIVDKPNDPLHLKWCKYCCRLNWIVHSAPFPSRSIVDSAVRRLAWVKRWRVHHRQRVLTEFLMQIVHGTRSMNYRYSEDQCDGFVTAEFILKEFLSEPQMRLSGTFW